MRLLSGYEPGRTPIDSPFIHLLSRLAKDFSAKDPILIPSSQGSGTAYLFGAHTPFAHCGRIDPETNIHAPNESMRLDDFRYMTAFVAAITTELGRNKECFLQHTQSKCVR